MAIVTYLDLSLGGWAGGGGGTPFNGLYGEAPPKRGTFFRLQVYEKVGISIWKGRELCHFIL